MILTAMSLGQNAFFQLWLDTENGRILKLLPVGSDVSSSGTIYNRDPGIGSTTSSFQVNASSEASTRCNWRT